MFVVTTHRKYKGKTYDSVSLVESYRENGKVKHRQISNITGWPAEMIEQFKLMLKGDSVHVQTNFTFKQGKSCGALFVIKEIARQTGVFQALGYGKESHLAMMQIMGRIINQGSRLKLAREWSIDQALEEVVGVSKVSEDDLYENLDWLYHKQESIENKLFTFRHSDNKGLTIYLYDVTSSYLEGVHNELAHFGYNRDGKKGKMQIVVGLLCDDQGMPVSIEVFDGNTQDTKTVASQLEKLKKRFKISNLVFVGDKGMVKIPQIEQIHDLQWNYITSITQPQIRTLLKEGVFQLELFENTIAEVAYGSERYMLRRNPVRKEEVEMNRESRITFIKNRIKEKNAYLKEHPKAKIETAQNQMNEMLVKRKLADIITISIEGDSLGYRIDEDMKKEVSQLDGCYAIKTDVPKDKASAETIHDRYKDLAEVEKAFRTMKTGHEELRPIFVRKESRTRGHVFVCMLSYLITKYIWDKCKELGYTLDTIIKTLDKIQYIIHEINGVEIKLLPKDLTKEQQEILSKLQIELPTKL